VLYRFCTGASARRRPSKCIESCNSHNMHDGDIRSGNPDVNSRPLERVPQAVMP